MPTVPMVFKQATVWYEHFLLKPIQRDGPLAVHFGSAAHGGAIKTSPKLCFF